MTTRPELRGKYACRLCRHDQWDHNLTVGCPHCTCMATPGEAGARADEELDLAILPENQRVGGYSVREKAPQLPAYDHPELILHIPDSYDKAKLASGSKWKDRFSTSVKTAATSLITYLEWPGDARRPDWPSRDPVPPADELGPFAVYRMDRAATARLRAEMAKMDPAKRLDQVPAARYGHTYSRRTTNKQFAAELREAIKRALR